MRRSGPSTTASPLAASLPRSARLDALVAAARRTRGFMPDAEGEALLAAAHRAGVTFAPNRGTSADSRAPANRATVGREHAVDRQREGERPVFVEVGAWCGKSTLYLGAAAEATGSVVFSVDHHRGSEENQPGWEFHEPDLVDADDGRIDTLPHWRRSVAAVKLEPFVVGVVGDSPTAAACWGTPLAFCFIDGGHAMAPATADFDGWAPHVALGGWLAMHDVFADPTEGGRAPYEIWIKALDSGEWEQDGSSGSLRVLRRVGPASPDAIGRRPSAGLGPPGGTSRFPSRGASRFPSRAGG